MCLDVVVHEIQTPRKEGRMFSKDVCILAHLITEAGGRGVSDLSMDPSAKVTNSKAKTQNHPVVV
jgi:hypothetical protein